MDTTSSPKHLTPTPAEVWGYGFLFVTLINLSSLVGIFIIPFMNSRSYQIMLMGLVALAVGVLCGSSLLFLIPDALGLNEIEELKHVYVWKCITVVGGIYLFFLVERFIKIFIHVREKRRKHRQEYVVTPDTVNSIDYKMSICGNGHSNDEEVITRDSGAAGGDHTNHEDQLLMERATKDSTKTGDTIVATSTTEDDVTILGHSHRVAPVAWMIIFGDSVHNFIDGLAIGAAFSDNVLSGISISVAVICEEFPHELGDFAILLKSGMSVRKAVLFNFLSACTCYLGLCLGILLGAMTNASRWVFALAGGMFLYISLVDMMPEINAAVDDEVESKIGKKTAFLIQNIGLVIGFGLMLLLSIYGSKIDFT